MIKKKLELTCNDMGIDSCSFKATGKSKHQVEEDMIHHAEKAHPEMLKAMNPHQKKKMMHDMDKLVHAET